MTAPIAFPSEIARDLAKVRRLTADLMLLVKDLDQAVGVTATAYARIDCLAHDASMKGFDLIAALGDLSETNSTRWSAQQDRSEAIDNAAELACRVRELAADLEGGAA